MSDPRPEPTAGQELVRLLEIEWDECTAMRVTGSIAADERHHQPWGIVHGGEVQPP